MSEPPIRVVFPATLIVEVILVRDLSFDSSIGCAEASEKKKKKRSEPESS